MSRKLAPWFLATSALAVALTSFAGPASADCADPFGKPEQVLDFHLKVSRADWTKLLAERVRNPDTMPLSAACMDVYTEYKAEFRCGADGPWLKVGLRRKKGEERGVEAFEKPPMKIDFNEDFMGTVMEAKGQRWPAGAGDLGFRKITLNNGTANKSADGLSVLSVLQSEHVSLRLLGKDVPLTPRTAFAKVTMYLDGAAQGEYLGVYILIEDLDRTALKRRGLAANGRLEKQSTADCRPEIDFDDGPPNEAKAAFDAFMAKNPAMFAGKWLEEAGKGVDVDSLLRQEAIREILVNGNDTIFNSINPTTMPGGMAGWGNNWYAYDGRTGVRQYAPWDMDLAFGQQRGACMPTPLQCPANVALLSWCAGGTPYPATTSGLGRRLACNPEVQKRYLEIMCQLTNGPLAADEMLKVWDQTYETLKTVVPLETARTWKGIDPLANPPAAPVNGVRVLETFGSENTRLKAWIPARVKFVQESIARLGVTCAAGCTAGATDKCTYLGCPSQRRCMNNRWTACEPTTACAQAPATDGGVAPGTDGGGVPGTDGGGSQPGSGGASGGGSGGSSGSAGSSGGTGGSSGSAGASGGPRGGTSGSAGSKGTNTPPASGSGKSGGCSLMAADRSGQGSSGLALALLALAGAALFRRRARG